MTGVQALPQSTGFIRFPLSCGVVPYTGLEKRKRKQNVDDRNMKKLGKREREKMIVRGRERRGEGGRGGGREGEGSNISRRKRR